MSFVKIINQRIVNENLGFFQDVIRSIDSKPIYVIGRNSEGISVIKNFNVVGIIDDYTQLQYWEGIKVFKSDSIDRDSIIINCSSSISPVNVKKSLIKKGFLLIVDFFELSLGDFRFDLQDFCKETRKDFDKNVLKYSSIYDQLVDSESKKAFENVILYRLTGNPFFMKDYSVRLDDQYLEDFMNFSNEVMVDIGAYDGATSRFFARKYPDYKSIHLFEPSSSNFNTLKSNLSNFQRIFFYNFGLSDNSESLNFDSECGSSSKVSDFGKSLVTFKKLDSVVNEKVSFIKIDIEGMELKALKGSQRILKKDKPKLAIAVYHSAEDFWKIPNFIFSVNPCYDLYFRHYTQGWSESIMYFIPKVNV